LRKGCLFCILNAEKQKHSALSDGQNIRLKKRINIAGICMQYSCYTCTITNRTGERLLIVSRDD